MEDYLTIILGTDAASYTLARGIHSAFGKKSVVCGAAILVPFYHSTIAELRIDENFASDPDVFVRVLNELYAEKKDQYKKFMILVPLERYLLLLYDNLERLDFEPVLPYPDRELVYKYVVKSNFYERMEEMGLVVPETCRLSRKNYRSLPLEGELFMKADDYNDFNSYDIRDKKKGYYLQDRAEALAYLDKIYASDFSGEMLVQTFVHGGDGTEYTVNGYRASDGRISISLARALLMDKRPMWVGNYLILCDSERHELIELAKTIIEGLDYYGFFNFDIKVDSKSGEAYVFELNFRLGRSSFAANLAGLNFPELAISDLIYGCPVQAESGKAFNWLVLGKAASEKLLEPELRPEFLNKDRLANTGNSIIYEHDNNLLHTLRLKRFINKMEKQYLS